MSVLCNYCGKVWVIIPPIGYKGRMVTRTEHGKIHDCPQSSWRLQLKGEERAKAASKKALEEIDDFAAKEEEF